jgi:DNA-directed RNA polymerase subunit RPC12/RpoP
MSLFFDVLKNKEVTVKCYRCSKTFISKLKYFIADHQNLSCPYCQNRVKNKLPEELENQLNLIKQTFDELEAAIENTNFKF